MIKYLSKSFEFDLVYTVNSFLYILKDLPILRDLLTDDIYKDSILKKIVKGFFLLQQNLLQLN